ncbi:MAG: hypothetical protein HZA83_01915, partial [Thaumarchaeota archaeon]|nr:hypothetical protein [Nitrososphaerota archaeon]
FCPRCCRSFGTHTAAKGCKFCNGAVRLLLHKKGEEKHPPRKYRYFCEKCGRAESPKRIIECPACKSNIAPLYKWDELGFADKMLIQLSRAKDEIKLSLRGFIAKESLHKEHKFWKPSLKKCTNPSHT